MRHNQSYSTLRLMQKNVTFHVCQKLFQSFYRVGWGRVCGPYQDPIDQSLLCG